MTCLFRHVAKKGTGGRPGTDVHLDRMAAYLVAMNGDPNKPEVAARQSAQNTGMTCRFTHVSETPANGQPSADVRLDRMAANTGMSCRFNQMVKPLPQGGGRARLDYHLDRMAANTGMSCILRDTAKRHKAVDVPASTTPAATPDLAGSS